MFSRFVRTPACDSRTDGQTDRRTDGRTHGHKRIYRYLSHYDNRGRLRIKWVTFNILSEAQQVGLLVVEIIFH